MSSHMQDYIHAMDRKQGDPATARVCQKDESHGRLTMHGSGGGLLCANKTSKRGEKLTLCEYVEPVSR